MKPNADYRAAARAALLLTFPDRQATVVDRYLDSEYLGHLREATGEGDGLVDAETAIELTLDGDTRLRARVARELRAFDKKTGNG